MNPLAQALERMRAAYPQQPFGDVAVRVYAEQLSDIDAEVVLAAVNRLLNTMSRMPTIADIRREVAEHELDLPTPEEAWQQALDGNRFAVPEVSAAMKAVGGPWLIRHTQSPETLRAQFRKHYEGIRAKAIRNAAVGLPIRPETLIEARKAVEAGEPVSINGHRLKALPTSTRIRPRPVMWRLAQRMAGREVPPPDEADMQDAIRILRDDRDGDHDVLYAEAERVLHLANEPDDR